MNQLKNPFIIGLLLAAILGCETSASLDQKEPWVRRDRAGSLDFAVGEWQDAESERAGKLRELGDEVDFRWHQTVEDFHRIPLTAYSMFY